MSFKSGGELFYREQEGPKDSEITQPGEGKDPGEGRTTPPGNPGFTNLPERDQMDPSSAKVIPDEMFETLRNQLTYQASARRVAARFSGGGRGKTAARIPEILGNTGPEIFQRASTVSIEPRRFSPSKGFWTFVATGSKGDRYMVRIKGIRKGNVKNLYKAQVKCSCTCPFWRWQGPEHWAKQNKYLYGRPRGTASQPSVMDPKGKHWACKHMLAALQIARTYRFGSTASAWSFEGELAPLFMPIPARVAARHALIFRPDGWEALGDEAYKEMDSWVSPSVVWRGMTSDEYKATVGSGKPIWSTGAYSHHSEGTNFAREPHDAESYVDFGRDDPRKTGKPNYIVGVKRSESMTSSRDGYIKSPDPVPASDVVVVWEVSPEGEALVGRKVRG